MVAAPTAPLIFCSYATPDRERVVPFVDHLAATGFDVWIDFQRLKGGQAWDREIKRALARATLIIVFISANSIDRRGYVQREMKLALDKYQEKLADDIYIIPVLLDDKVQIPDIISDIHCVKSWIGDPRQEIEDAIRHQLATIGVQIQKAQEYSRVSWTKELHEESWDGIPGYDISYNTIYFDSKEYRNLNNISSYLNGEIISRVMDERRVKFHQDTEAYSFGDERSLRTNTFDMHCADPIVVGKVLSIQYSVHVYYSGAAHPNGWFFTQAFALDPVTRIDLEGMFVDRDKALSVLQARVREKLLATPEPSSDGHVYELSKEWVEQGTAELSHFSNYLFRKEGMEFIFPPYQVGSYADGIHWALVEYKHLVEFFVPHVRSALGLKYAIYLSEAERDSDIFTR